ncbi:MAG: ATP-binding protein [Bradymonadia bacterium]
MHWSPVDQALSQHIGLEAGAAIEVVRTRCPEGVTLRVLDETPDGQVWALLSDVRGVITALEAAEGDFRALIEHSPDALAVCRGEAIVYTNPRMLNLLGLSSSEALLGQALSNMVHTEERRSLERFAAQGASYQFSPRTFRLRHHTGHQVMVEMLQFPVRYEGEDAVVLLARDVTERQQLLARAVQMDRTLAVGALASGVSHEINNPLAFVSANLEFAMHELDWLTQWFEAQGMMPGLTDTGIRSRLDEMRDALAEAREGADRVRGVVSDLRLLARGPDGLPRAISPARIMDSAIQLTRNEFKHRARVERDYQPTAPVVVDEGRLSQVFLNLLLNAAHAIPEGDFEQNRVVARVRQGDGWVVIEVFDSGIGVPEDIADRIFEPFFTTKPMGQGTGMGLSLSKDIIESMGGHLSFSAQAEGGTCFRVALPSGLIGGEPTPLPSQPTPIAVPRGRVLIVDDEPLVGRSLRRMLSDEHDVEALTNARAALDLLASGAKFDVILCDVMMPDMSGAAFHEALQAQWPEMTRRLIFITGEAFTPDARAFVEQSHTVCLDKPVSPRLLRRVIRKMMGTALGAY